MNPFNMYLSCCLRCYLFVPQFRGTYNMWLNTWLVRPWRLSKTPPVADPKKIQKKNKKRKEQQIIFLRRSIKLITVLYFPGSL